MDDEDVELVAGDVLIFDAENLADAVSRVDHEIAGGEAKLLGHGFLFFLEHGKDPRIVQRRPEKAPAAKRAAATEALHRGRRTTCASIVINNTKAREKPVRELCGGC